MKNKQNHPHQERELLNIADESPVKVLFREWLADQFSPDKNRENRRLNNREELRELGHGIRFLIPLLIANVAAVLMLMFLGNTGMIITTIMFFTLLAIYVIRGLRAVRRGVSDSIRENKSKFLRLKSEALVLLELIPEDAKEDEVVQAFRETDNELKYQNSLDKTVLGFMSKAFTVGPLAVLALAYLLHLVTSMDAKAFIEGNKQLGEALGYVIAMGLVIAFFNDFIMTLRTTRTERIAQVVALAQDAYTRRSKLSAESESPAA